MQNYSNAAKAFIVKDNKLLLIKRAPGAPHNPETWDLPGGRLNPGENPYDGLKRELREETGLDIEILLPFVVQYFTRQDGQVITLIIFLCKALSDDIRLSDEHTHYQWHDLAEESEDIMPWLKKILADFYHYRLNEFV